MTAQARDGGQKLPEAAQRRILPGATIGILGGGQLGRMMALAGSHLGYRFVTLDPTPDSPCGQVAALQLTAAYDDVEAACTLAELSDVITYEFENVDARVTELLERECYVPQGSDLLYITQHRLREKRAIEASGAKVAPYEEIASFAQLRDAALRLGMPCVLKTATGGYDGKGQRVIRSAEEADAAYAELSRARTELVLERFIRFERELSVIAARSPGGEVRTFPAAENVHVDNILHLSIVPARVPQDVLVRAERLARSVADSLGVVGLLAVEMFVTEDGELFVNELAPRPHNSGHYTMEACATSQFEQHVRAVCNLPLGPTTLRTPVVMVNVLGEHVEPLREWLAAQPSGGGMEGAVGIAAQQRAGSPDGAAPTAAQQQAGGPDGAALTTAQQWAVDPDGAAPTAEQQQAVDPDGAAPTAVKQWVGSPDGAEPTAVQQSADVRDGAAGSLTMAAGGLGGEDGVIAKLHIYGKHEEKPKRKMGHLNLLTDDVEKALAWVERTGIWREQESKRRER